MNSFVPQGYHSHVKSKLLSVHVCGTQLSEEVIPFQSIIVLLRSNEKKHSRQQYHLFVLMKIPFPSTRVILK
jgi:hypothetical protein